MEIDIDLKWSLWSADPYHWDEQRADRALDKMRSVFSGEATEPMLTVRTSPRKESRTGTVIVTKGKAEVVFKTLWDSPEDLVPERIPDAVRSEAAEHIRAWLLERHGFTLDSDPIGAKVQESVSADSFEDLLKKVDACEEKLIAADKTADAEFQKMLTDMVETCR